jgi:hypothetical protein
MQYKLENEAKRMEDTKKRGYLRENNEVKEGGKEGKNVNKNKKWTNKRGTTEWNTKNRTELEKIIATCIFTLSE